MDDEAVDDAEQRTPQDAEQQQRRPVGVLVGVGEQTEQHPDEQAEPGTAHHPGTGGAAVGHATGHGLDHAQVGTDDLDPRHLDLAVGDVVDRPLRLLVRAALTDDDPLHVSHGSPS